MGTAAVTAPSPESTDPLFKTEAEIAALLGVSLELWRATARVLEKSGLPLGDPLFAGRRYWPAVRAYLDRRSGLGARLPHRQPDGEENLDVFRSNAGRSGPKEAAAARR